MRKRRTSYPAQPWQHSWCVNDKTKFSRFPGTMIWNLERPGFTACGVNLRAPGHHPPPAVAHFPPGCCSPVSAWLPRPHWRVVSAGDPVRPCTRHLMCELLAGRDQVWGLLPVLRLPGNPIAALPAAHLPLLPQLNYTRFNFLSFKFNFQLFKFQV